MSSASKLLVLAGLLVGGYLAYRWYANRQASTPYYGYDADYEVDPASGLYKNGDEYVLPAYMIADAAENGYVIDYSQFGLPEGTVIQVDPNIMGTDYAMTPTINLGAGDKNLTAAECGCFGESCSVGNWLDCNSLVNSNNREDYNRVLNTPAGYHYVDSGVIVTDENGQPVLDQNTGKPLHYIDTIAQYVGGQKWIARNIPSEVIDQVNGGIIPDATSGSWGSGITVYTTSGQEAAQLSTLINKSVTGNDDPTGFSGEAAKEYNAVVTSPSSIVSGDTIVSSISENSTLNTKYTGTFSVSELLNRPRGETLSSSSKINETNTGTYTINADGSLTKSSSVEGSTSTASSVSSIRPNSFSGTISSSYILGTTSKSATPTTHPYTGPSSATPTTHPYTGPSTVASNQAISTGTISYTPTKTVTASSSDPAWFTQALSASSGGTVQTGTTKTATPTSVSKTKTATPTSVSKTKATTPASSSGGSTSTNHSPSNWGGWSGPSWL